MLANDVKTSALNCRLNGYKTYEYCVSDYPKDLKCDWWTDRKVMKAGWFCLVEGRSSR